jgi:hypothetical protein
MTLELLVCGEYCPITGLKIVGYSDKPYTEHEKFLARKREKAKRDYSPEKRKARYSKQNKEK